MMEVVANLIVSIVQGEQAENSLSQITSFYDILQTRFMDINSYVRSKVLQLLIKLAEYFNQNQLFIVAN